MKLPCPHCNRKFHPKGIHVHIATMHKASKASNGALVEAQTSEDLRPTPEEQAALTLGLTLRQLRFALKEIHKQVVSNQ